MSRALIDRVMTESTVKRGQTVLINFTFFCGPVELGPLENTEVMKWAMRKSDSIVGRGWVLGQ